MVISYLKILHHLENGQTNLIVVVVMVEVGVVKGGYREEGNELV